jgi:hypothetical protein
MKFAIHASLFTLVIGVCAFAHTQSIDGNWTVEYVSGLQMKTIGGAEFNFHTHGDHLTGTANVGVGWPGKAAISNGKFEGEHISFTVVGLQGSSDGFPKMDFAGTIHGDEIKLTMTFYADGERVSGKAAFEGKRTPNN